MTFNNFIICLLLASLSGIGCRRFEEEKDRSPSQSHSSRATLYPIERLPEYFNRVAVLPCFHSDPDSPRPWITSMKFFIRELSQERIFETIKAYPPSIK